MKLSKWWGANKTNLFIAMTLLTGVKSVETVSVSPSLQGEISFILNQKTSVFP
jgi:hypothetical protein